jgi:hypothetical protein
MTNLEIIRALFSVVCNVMTEEQLDTPVPSLKGVTARQLLGKASMIKAEILEIVPSKESAVTGEIKGYWHPHGFLSARKRNAEWQALVLKNSL